MKNTSANIFLSKLFYVLSGSKKQLLFLIILFLFISLMEVVGVGLIAPFITLATNPNAIQQNPWLNRIYLGLNFSSQQSFLWLIGALILLTFYAKSFFTYSGQKYVFQFGFRQQKKLSNRLMEAYLAAPYTFHLSRNSAVLIQNITYESDKFANALVMPLLTSIANLAVTFALIALLIKTSAAATLLIASTLLLVFMIYYRIKERLAYLGKEISESHTEMIRMINHGLGGLKETKVIGCEPYFVNQLDEQVGRYSDRMTRSLAFSILPRYIIEACLITFLILFTFFFTAAHQDNPQNLSGILGVFALASIRLLPATSNLMGAMNGLKLNSYLLDKLYLDLKEIEEFNGKRFQETYLGLAAVNSRVTIPFQKQIELEQVIYRYPNAQTNALEGITLDIQKGQSIGLIGRSGAGKTTLVDVILGLLVPQSGDIRVDGRSIYADLRAWQNLIGYVPQSIFVIDDTLEQNIAFGVPDHLIDQSKLQKAIQIAQLSELVDHLPEGLKTNVGERGVLLSGGQRQRVGIARAIYHEREILVFDEATAALDNETESLVTDAIKSLSGMKTMIIIAHRLSTIEHCDRIYLMEQGEVIQSGTYREVVLREQTSV
jgi:ABC-type multidrug transport system fused ATPase/permease subunit